MVRTVSGALVPAIRLWLDGYARELVDEGLSNDLEYLCCCLNNVETCFEFGETFLDDMGKSTRALPSPLESPSPSPPEAFPF